MELKSALKPFSPFKIVCNDRGNPVAVIGNLSPFKINIAVKYKIKRKKIPLSFAKGYGEKDKPMIKTQVRYFTLSPLTYTLRSGEQTK